MDHTIELNENVEHEEEQAAAAIAKTTSSLSNEDHDQQQQQQQSNCYHQLSSSTCTRTPSDIHTTNNSSTIAGVVPPATTTTTAATIHDDTDERNRRTDDDESLCLTTTAAASQMRNNNNIDDDGCCSCTSSGKGTCSFCLQFIKTSAAAGEEDSKLSACGSNDKGQSAVDHKNNSNLTGLIVTTESWNTIRDIHQAGSVVIADVVDDNNKYQRHSNDVFLGEPIVCVHVCVFCSRSS